MKLRTALAAIRQLSPPVTTTELGGGDSADGGKSQVPQGFNECVTTVTTVTTDFTSTPHFRPSEPARPAPASVTSLSVVTGGDGGDSQQRRGIPLSPLPEGAVVTVVTPPWTDDRAWCRRINDAGLKSARREVLFAWVAAAGGWSDAAAVYLPVSLPRCLALADLRTHARCLGLAVVEDLDGPELMAWLRSPSP